MSKAGPYRTLASRIEHQPDPVKGSRFIGLAAPVSTEEQAASLLDEARQRWPDTTHHCWAWRLVDERARSSDAGEPGGSAGRPILAMIDGHRLHGVAVVVTRWFGGTKLGIGGLIRAYGGCAGQTLDRGQIVARVPTTDLWVEHEYPDTGAVQAVLGSKGIAPRDTSWGVRVRMRLCVPTDQTQDLVDALRNATSGRIQLGDAVSDSPDLG
ncbi:MAG: YigZ family protein [Oligoflexia bacterium]|nr:YigZ family protein [Oligoflexia bacterium]